jgi:hypothetical protein
MVDGIGIGTNIKKLGKLRENSRSRLLCYDALTWSMQDARLPRVEISPELPANRDSGEI